jgi:hypothetical protein
LELLAIRAFLGVEKLKYTPGNLIKVLGEGRVWEEKEWQTAGFL